ncbi:c-type cytochrome [Spirosoma pollinicola]|uniref:Cytochrome C class I n=1 Tax=Spirosoma pollinicola TaxID=2057025 RepID=A0A2K8Z5J4_9BACT|nr:cytochrome c [Spirosoma pollinicola]AUD05089.1 cytochrome C class I [Spirosoma pollinicola]
MKFIVTLLFCLSLSVAFAQTKKPVTKAAAKPTAVATKAPGQLIYEQNCLTCHQANGSGVPNLNPPLRQTDWVLGDKNRLINVLLKGLQGQEIEGDMYDNAMPAHDFLNDAQIADVLTYIRSNFGNKADAVTADEVKALRAVK